MRRNVFDDVERQFLRELRRLGWSIVQLAGDTQWTANHRGLSRRLGEVNRFDDRRAAIKWAASVNAKVQERAARIPGEAPPSRMELAESSTESTPGPERLAKRFAS